jgi:hypothetical protein
MTHANTTTTMTISKTATTITEVDAASVPCPTLESLQGATHHLRDLAIAFYAGNIPQGMRDAMGKKGALLTLFSAADADAVRKLLKLSIGEIQDGWQAFVTNAKRVRGVSIQALSKACAAPKVRATSVWEQVQECISAMTQEDFQGLPVDLYDILVAGEITPAEPAQTA